MFNDIDWTRKGNEDICPSNAEKRCTRRYSRRDLGRSWVLETERSVVEDAITHLKENGIPIVSQTGATIQGNRAPNIHKCQCPESWNPEDVERKMKPYASMRIP